MLTLNAVMTAWLVLAMASCEAWNARNSFSISTLPRALKAQNDEQERAVAAVDNVIASLPNTLTVTRLLLVPVVGAAVCNGATGIATSAFVVASITDWLDGYIARTWHAESQFGAFLDPVVDKLLVSVALIALSATLGPVVAFPAALIISREISVSALREWCAQRGQHELVKVGWSGKAKTTMQMVALSLLLVASSTQSLLGQIGLVLLNFATLLTVQSGLGYLRVAWPLLTTRKTEASADVRESNSRILSTWR